MKKKIAISIGILLVVCGLLFGGIGLKRYLEEKNAGNVYEELKVQVSTEPLLELPQIGEPVYENPIDFESLTAQYPDIYAWIHIPGTRVDYPIVQRDGDNTYYLNHTIEGRRRAEGAIFTEDYNGKDFEDPNTIIYGHNMKNGSMFKGLHKYKDRQYFAEHSELFIYQENRILRYKIFAAYTYDSRHLMLSFDFNDENVYRAYLDSVLTRKDMSSNIDASIKITSEDSIITLSTCNNNDKQRYLVQAVLLSIQEK